MLMDAMFAAPRLTFLYLTLLNWFDISPYPHAHPLSTLATQEFQPMIISIPGPNNTILLNHRTLYGHLSVTGSYVASKCAE